MQDFNQPAFSILIVEDDPGLGALIRRRLASAGLESELTRDGAAALNNLARHSYDLVLLDYSLPDMPCSELVETAREMGRLPAFIVMSSFGDERVAVDQMKSGARDFLVKDMGFLDRLPEAVQRVLQRVKVERRLDEAELALENSRLELAAIYENSPIALLLLDQEREILRANRAANQLIDPDRCLVPGMHIGEFLNCAYCEGKTDGRGFKEACQTCELCQSIESTFESGCNLQGTESRIPLSGGEEPRSLWIRSSTASVFIDGRSRVLLSLEDLTAQRAAEERLRSTHQRLQATLTAVNEGLWDWDLSSGAVWWSELSYRMIGFEPGEFPMSLEKWYSLLHPGDRDATRRNIERQITAGQRFDVEFRCGTKEGNWIWIRGRGRVVEHDGQGNPTRVMGTFNDISEAKAISVRLAGQALQLDAIRVAQGAFIADSSGESILHGLAEAALTLTSSKWSFLAEMLAERDGLSSSSTEPGKTRIYRSAAGESPGEDQIRSLTERIERSGEVLNLGDAGASLKASGRSESRVESGGFLGIPLKLGGQVLGVLGLADRPGGYAPDDVLLLEPFTSTCAGLIHAIHVRSREWRYFEALRLSEERFRNLVEHAPVGIFVQVDGNFVYVNETAVRLFGGSSPEELITMPVACRFYQLPHSLEEERSLTSKAGKDPVPGVTETCLRLDGSAFESELSAIPFSFAGEPGTLVFFHDVSEKKRLEAQFRQAQKMEAVGQLTGGVAHDFNNTLAATLMHLALLKSNPSLDSEALEVIEDLEKEANHAADLTRQLLLFSRRSVMRTAVVDLNSVLTEMYRILHRLIGERIAIELDREVGLPLIEADSGMLEQVVMNLCVNARDAMPEGGRLSLKTEKVSFNEGALPANPDARTGAFVCLTVSDSGFGMSPEVICRIFDPFYTTKEAGKGTGLGLSTVYGIIRQHQGWVDVQSSKGQGSSFKVYFPVSEIQPEKREHRITNRYQGGSETILLVEDEMGLRRTMSLFLSRLGYQIVEAGDGIEALKIWRDRASQVDLLLTDMIMPNGLNGLDLCSKLQQDKPGLKAIISSGYNEQLADIDETGAGRKFIFLPKPCPSTRLAATVRACLDGTPLPAEEEDD